MKQQISRMMLNKYRDTKLVLPPYNPRADFGWIQIHSKLPWLKLEIGIPLSTIVKEIDDLPIPLSSHREEYNDHRGWKSACIHGRSFLDTREDQHYDSYQPYRWTKEALEYLPKTVEYFRSHWPASNFQRLRIMLLEPGGYITLHKDSDVRKLSAINIAITQPDDCCFVMETHGCVPFASGDVFWLDISNNHVVFNDSDQKRWHIIVHQDLDCPEFQDIVVKSYHNLYNKNLCDKHDS